MNALDPAIARQLAAELPRDVFLDVVRAFETDLAALTQRVADAMQAANLDGYRRGAHALAGAAGGIGAFRLEAMARRAMAPDSQMDPEAVQALKDEVGTALGELHGLAGELPKP